MAKTFITLDTRIDTLKDEFNNLVNKVGDLSTLTTDGLRDSDIVQAINIHDAELGAITASDMGTTASTVSTAILELDTEADSDRSNFANNIRTIMLDPDGTGTSREVTASANNSTNENAFLTFVDGATGSQGIETDTGLTYNPSTGLITAVSLAAATLDISGNVDIDGTLEVGAISGTSADFDAGVTIDNITIDGTEIDLSSGDLTVDVAGNIRLDADDNGEVRYLDGGTQYLYIKKDGNTAVIQNVIQDGDIHLIGDDGGSAVTALKLDMSADGAATFKSSVTTTGLILGSTAVTSTAAELNKLDGVLTTTAEFNIMDGGTSASSTTLADADRVVVNDAGTMKQVALTDFEVYMETSLDTLANVTTVGALNAGSITSGFGTIDIGSSTIASGAITAAGVGTFSSLDISGNVDVDGILEADAITVNGATLAETISDTIGAMVGSNTETGVTVSYEDGDNTLDFVMGTTQTTITSLKNAALVVGRDADNDIDFATDNNIIFRAAGADQIRLQDGALVPVTNNDIDLGTASLEFKNAFFDGTVTADAFSGPLSGNVTGTADVATTVAITQTDTSGDTEQFITFVDTVTGPEGIRTDTGLKYNPATNTITANVSGDVTGSVQQNITGVGTLTRLRVDHIEIDGNTIFATDSSGSSDTIIFRASNEDFVRIQAGAIVPVTNNRVDLGTSSLKFKDAFFDGTVTSDAFVGPLAGAVTGNASTATALASTNAFSITGDVTANAINFTGAASNPVALSSTIGTSKVTTSKIATNAVTSAKIAASAVTTAKIGDDAVTYAKMQHTTTNNRVLGAVTAGTIGEVQITAAMIADFNVGLEKIETIPGNTVLVRDAANTGPVTAKSVSNTQILIGDGTGFTAAALSGDVTMTNAGAVSLDAAQTNITSLLAADIKIGEDDQTKIDFETANQINFYANNANRLTLTDVALIPQTTNEITLGSDTKEFKDAFFDGTVTADAFSGPLSGTASLATAITATNDTGNAAHFVPFIDGATGTQAIKTDAGLKYNPHTDTLTAGTFSGALSLADGSVVTAKIADGNITAAKMAVNSINSDQYQDASIDHEHLSADCVDKDNLATLRTFTLKDSAGTTLFTMFGAGS